MNTQPLRVGIGGPVGSGKTALTLALCLALRERYNLAVVTNDIIPAKMPTFWYATRRWHPNASLAWKPVAVPILPYAKMPRSTSKRWIN